MNRIILFGVALITAVCFAVIIGGTIALLDLLFG